MPIRDLFWGCPTCGSLDALRPGEAGEACRSCDTVYRRGPKALIIARTADGREVSRAANEWLALLPGECGRGGVEHVTVSAARGFHEVRRDEELLGFFETMGEEAAGTWELHEDDVVIRLIDQEPVFIPLLDLTAIQPTSTSLHLKARGRPLLNVVFRDASVRLWELRLQHAVQTAWHRAGKGPIVEFQPLISAR